MVEDDKDLSMQDFAKQIGEQMNQITSDPEKLQEAMKLFSDDPDKLQDAMKPIMDLMGGGSADSSNILDMLKQVLEEVSKNQKTLARINSRLKKLSETLIEEDE